ncbi:MAG: hypothetical protein ACMG6S_16170 [Byssovorax sp.]
MRLISSLASVCLLLGLSGCFVSTSNDPVGTRPLSGEGALVIDWTINGSRDPNQCNQASASRLEIIVVPDVGRSSAFSQDCDLFGASIPLEPGTYSASALLVDSGGHARTTTIEIDAFTIRGDDELHAPIDFPASSFF